ncbi:unnamed protein product [Haemonchus placei]|uniref:Amino acid transporter n=1 Tax=Haemonchus placei TaxID=6290 RepID=A0A0N4X645_HAEPC|nr:unnamed protein product [Haemonchus placei]
MHESDGILTEIIGDHNVDQNEDEDTVITTAFFTSSILPIGVTTILLVEVGDYLNISTYSPISLPYTIFKVLARALSYVVEKVMKFVPEEQAGFSVMAL